MANIQQLIRIELDPTKPVQEICSVISAVAPLHPQEAEILKGIRDAIDQRLEILKGDKSNGK